MTTDYTSAKHASLPSNGTNFRAVLLCLGAVIPLCMVLFTGCRPMDPEEWTDPVDEVFQRDWVLIDAHVYVENTDIGQYHVYDYFDDTTSLSSMSLFDESGVLMDEIHQFQTTWYFNHDTMLLNGEHRFEMEHFGNGFGTLVLRPYGLFAGTARPIMVTGMDDHHLQVSVRESYNSDGVYNYHYVSELLFADGDGPLELDTTTWEGYTHNGTWRPMTGENSLQLSNSTWVLSRYNNGLSGDVYPNDTITFHNPVEYSISGGPVKQYRLNGLVGNPRMSLNLFDFTPLGGDYVGQVLPSAIDDGAIQSTSFHDLFNVSNSVTVWMHRLP